jgi:hypothetical protein
MRDIKAECGDLIGIEQDLGHGLYARGIEFVELLDVTENLAEIVGHAMHFFGRKLEIGEIGDVADLFF